MSNPLTAMLLSMNEDESARNNYIRAPIPYPGAKSRCIKHLLPHLPYRNTFLDVCGGSGTVMFARNASPLDVYNDQCSGLVAFYRCIRDVAKCTALIERIKRSPCSSREEFLWCRDSWQEIHNDDVERAARWYYALMTSFSSKGWSFGRATKGVAQCGKIYNNLELFWPVHNRLRNAQIENQDWRMILKDYATTWDCVAYIDPPYWGTFGIYNNEWPEAWHYELCEQVHKLPCFVAVSGYDSPNHPYNTFKFWTRKESWEVRQSMTAQAYTQTNNLKEGSMPRELATETLWIYDPK